MFSYNMISPFSVPITKSILVSLLKFPEVIPLILAVVRLGKAFFSKVRVSGVCSATYFSMKNVRFAKLLVVLSSGG